MGVFWRQVRERLMDERGQSTGFFLKLGLAAAIVALIIVQIGPILSNQLQVNDVAKNAADIGVAKYRASKGNMNEVKLSIIASLEDQNARLAGEVSTYKNDAGEQVLSFTARKIARTFLFYHVGVLAPYTEALSSVSVSFDY
jgi:hypothetical protein